MKVKRSYLSYLYHSKGRHGVHSPFVFELMDKCLTTKMDKNFSITFNSWTYNWKNSRVSIDVKDFGAGSKHTTKRSRKLADIFKSASTKGVYGQLLYKIVEYYQPKNILELGTSIGSGSFFCCAALKEGKITTVEACKETFEKAKAHFPPQWKDKITFENKLFTEFLDEVKEEVKWDLVYLDGHHDARATTEYITKIYPHLHPNSLLIIDDIRWSTDMWEGWCEWVRDNRFHVAMDFGRWGILVPRKEQTKEYFVLRPFVLRTPWF